MTAINENPLLKLENVLPIADTQDAEQNKLRAITASLQAMSPHMKALGDGLRHPTDEELIDEAAAACQRVSTICRELKQKCSVKFDAELEQNIDLLHDVLNNLAGIRMSYYLIGHAESCNE